MQNPNSSSGKKNKGKKESAPPTSTIAAKCSDLVSDAKFSGATGK